MILNPSSNLLTWIPNGQQVGSFEISLLIKSTNYRVYHNFTLEVSRSIRIWDFSLENPEEYQHLKGVINIRGTVLVDPGIVEMVYVKVGDGEWNETTLLQDTWSLELDTRKLADGETEIRFKVFDGVVYSDRGSIIVLIDNNEGRTSPLIFLLLLIPILVLIPLIILIRISMKRKKIKKEEEMEMIQREEDMVRSKHDLETFLEYASSFQLKEQAQGSPIEEGGSWKKEQ
jgi:hypothetical protein